MTAKRASVCNRGRNCASPFLDLCGTESYDQGSGGTGALVPITTMMKRVIALAVVLVASCAPAFAQSASVPPTSTGRTKPLADVAKDEEARRKEVRKPAKVYTNGNLRPDISGGIAPPPSVATPEATASNTTAGNASPGAPAAAAPAMRDQAFWSARMKAAQDQITRTQIFIDSLQSRINALRTEFVNRDDPAQRAKIETDRNTALAELERVKKELDDQTKAVKAIQDEARRAGVPPGWLRPGA